MRKALHICLYPAATNYLSGLDMGTKMFLGIIILY